MIKRIINKLGIYKTYPLTLLDKKFKVQIHKGIGFPHFWDAEPWMSTVLQKLGSNDARFLDVGVNIGQTLLKWKALFPESEYVGFEPNRNCVSYVEKLIENNALKNCYIHPYGLSTTKADGKLYLLGKDNGDSSASTIKDFRPNEKRRAISIQTIPLKSIDIKPFDIVKIDVEGSELEVLQSLFEITKNAVIICEILPVYSVENKERLARQNSIQEILNDHGYSIYRIIKGSTTTLRRLEKLEIHSDVSLSDYVFIPKPKEGAIIANFN